MNVKGEHRNFLVLFEMEITFFNEVEDIGYSLNSWVKTRKQHDIRSQNTPSLPFTG